MQLSDSPLPSWERETNQQAQPRIGRRDRRYNETLCILLTYPKTWWYPQPRLCRRAETEAKSVKKGDAPQRRLNHPF